jgi:polysaccharide biosynthesis protein PslG
MALFRQAILLLALFVVLVAPVRAQNEASLRYAIHTLPADDRSLQLARRAGFDTVVEVFSWRDIEPTRGQFHWQRSDEVVQGAAYYGLDLVVRLDQHPIWASPVTTAVNAPPEELADYTDFVRRVAERYQDLILGYIIWNEPNLAIDWGGELPDPAGYTEMLKAAYQAIKEADPAALVVSAALAPTNEQSPNALDDRIFLRQMYDAGAGPYFDVLGAHPYGFAYPPDDPPGAHDSLNLARVEDLRAIMVEYGDGAKPVWATEFGWTVEATDDRAWQVVTPQQQADYLVRTYERAAAEWPWLQLLAVWNLGGEAHPEWGGFSLLTPEGRPRPAYHALAAMPKPAPVAPARTGRLVAQQQVARRYTVLAADSVIHLGDSQFPPPWMPLYGVRNPSTDWRGLFYLADPGGEPWTLTVRIMQANEWGNFVWVNGVRLEPTFGREDFSASWVAQSWPVPAEMLRPGANEVRVTIASTTPVMQDRGWRWDDLQFKEIVLWQE